MKFSYGLFGENALPYPTLAAGQRTALLKRDRLARNKLLAKLRRCGFTLCDGPWQGTMDFQTISAFYKSARFDFTFAYPNVSIEGVTVSRKIFFHRKYKISNKPWSKRMKHIPLDGIIVSGGDVVELEGLIVNGEKVGMGESDTFMVDVEATSWWPALSKIRHKKMRMPTELSSRPNITRPSELHRFLHEKIVCPDRVVVVHLIDAAKVTMAQQEPRLY